MSPENTKNSPKITTGELEIIRYNKNKIHYKKKYDWFSSLDSSPVYITIIYYLFFELRTHSWRFLSLELFIYLFFLVWRAALELPQSEYRLEAPIFLFVTLNLWLKEHISWQLLMYHYYTVNFSLILVLNTYNATTTKTTRVSTKILGKKTILVDWETIFKMNWLLPKLHIYTNLFQAKIL